MKKGDSELLAVKKALENTSKAPIYHSMEIEQINYSASKVPMNYFVETENHTQYISRILS